MIGQHLLLKSVSLAVITPFFSASLVETVQSEIASERPGILDVFKEGKMPDPNRKKPRILGFLSVARGGYPRSIHGVLESNHRRLTRESKYCSMLLVHMVLHSRTGN